MQLLMSHTIIVELQQKFSKLYANSIVLLYGYGASNKCFRFWTLKDIRMGLTPCVVVRFG